MKANNETPFYRHDGKCGVLVEKYDEAAHAWCEVFVPEEELESIESEDDLRLTLEDTDCGYGGEVEIVETGVMNPENEQRIIMAWVSKDYAASDEYERELCATTTSYYDWTSERTKMIDKIQAAIRNGATIEQTKACVEEWKSIVGRYSNPLGAVFPKDPDFESVLKEAWDGMPYKGSDHL